MVKRWWRCHVCNDLHYGERPPEICPTCGFRNCFARTDQAEASRIMDVLGQEDEELSTPEAVIRSWREFAEQSKLFELTANQEEIDLLCSGVLENRAGKGLRYCPCRIASGDAEKDLELICPCNFIKQKNWKELGECWCGLFVKRRS